MPEHVHLLVNEPERGCLAQMLHNPVVRGLVERPEDWLWSSFRHYFAGADGVVEIKSQWTSWRRERLGIIPTVRIRSDQQNPAQAKLERGTLKSYFEV
jgi:hypothetical protein